MGNIADSVETPSEDFLEKCSKEQLLKIAEHYKIEIDGKRLKDTVEEVISKANLVEMGVLMTVRLKSLLFRLLLGCLCHF